MTETTPSGIDPDGTSAGCGRCADVQASESEYLLCVHHDPTVPLTVEVA